MNKFIRHIKVRTKLAFMVMLTIIVFMVWPILYFTIRYERLFHLKMVLEAEWEQISNELNNK